MYCEPQFTIHNHFNNITSQKSINVYFVLRMLMYSNFVMNKMKAHSVVRVGCGSVLRSVNVHRRTQSTTFRY